MYNMAIHADMLIIDNVSQETAEIGCRPQGP